MNPTKKFWYDENSEPPKNYIWMKNDKQYEFSVSERRWKEISSSEESGSSSKEITIDDVVKFIHDNANSESAFPYTTYNEIPIMPEDENDIEGYTIYRDGIPFHYKNIYLNFGNYIIGHTPGSR